MNRIMTLFWVVSITGAAFLLYSVKDDVRSMQTKILETKKELDQETESLNVIAAEWEYLNRPERLRSLASRYLASSSATVEQIAVIEAIPFPKQMQASPKQGRASPVQRVSYRAGVRQGR